MKYINRDENNKISGVFARPQRNDQESLSGDSPEYLDFLNKKGLYEADYITKRKQLYKPIPEQLDMQYNDLINATTTWKDHVELVKSTYPKPV